MAGGGALAAGGDGVAVPLLGAATAAGAALAGTVSGTRLGVGLVAVEATAGGAMLAGCEGAGVAAGADAAGRAAGASAVDAAGVLVVLEGVVVELGCVPTEVCAAADGLPVPEPSQPKP